MAHIFSLWAARWPNSKRIENTRRIWTTESHWPTISTHENNSYDLQEYIQVHSLWVVTFSVAPFPHELVLDLMEGLVPLHLPNLLFAYASPVATRPISKGLLGRWYPILFLFTTKPVKSRILLSTTSVLLSSPIERCQNGVRKIGNWSLTHPRGGLT